MKVIAVSGWKGSGKDTVADYLVKEKGYSRYGFADILKDLVAEQYNIPRAWCDSQEHKEVGILKYILDPKDKFSENIARFMFKEFRLPARDINPYLSFDEYLERSDNFQLNLCWTPRALCILEGSIKRSVTSQFWVEKVINSVKDEYFNKANSNSFVISDLRYKSEVEQLSNAFGSKLTTVRVNRFTSSPSNDPSERDLDNYKFDVIIDNKSSLEDLYKVVDNKLV